jgi:hypothetical protein
MPITRRVPVLQKLSSARAQIEAIRCAKKLLLKDILNDPQFKGGFGWAAKKEQA